MNETRVVEPLGGHPGGGIAGEGFPTTEHPPPNNIDGRRRAGEAEEARVAA